jgi:hypothetical protein
MVLSRFCYFKALLLNTMDDKKGVVEVEFEVKNSKSIYTMYGI